MFLTATARGTPNSASATTATPTMDARARRVISDVEAVADVTQRGDIHPRPGELLAQARDVHVERLRRAVPVAVPDLGHDPLAHHGRSGMRREQSEQIELLRPELELDPGHQCATSIAVDRQIA